MIQREMENMFIYFHPLSYGLEWFALSFCSACVFAGDELNDVMSAAVMQKLGRQPMALPMEEVLHHLGWKKNPVNIGTKVIKYLVGAGFLPSNRIISTLVWVCVPEISRMNELIWQNISGNDI